MTTDPELSMRFAALAERRLAAELDLLAAVACDPGRGMPVAEAAGACQHLFANEDLRLIWLACDVARGRPLPGVLSLARAALFWGGHWVQSTPDQFGPLWTGNSLVRLAGLHYHSPVAIQAYARRLIAIEARQHAAEESFRRTVRLLDDEVERSVDRLEPVTLPAPRRTGVGQFTIRLSESRGAA